MQRYFIKKTIVSIHHDILILESCYIWIFFSNFDSIGDTYKIKVIKVLEFG